MPTVYRPYPRRLQSLAVCRCHCKSHTISLVILKPRVLLWPGFEPSTACLAYGRRLSNWANRATVSSKISGFSVASCLVLWFLFLTFSLYSRFGFSSACCFCSLWIQPWSGALQWIRSSSCLLTAFLAPPLISTTIITWPRRPSLTLADSWVAIFSSLVVLACLKLHWTNLGWRVGSWSR